MFSQTFFLRRFSFLGSRFKINPDLFAINSPFLMDTQFEKLNSAVASPKSTVNKDGRKRKRKRTVPLNPGEEAANTFHEQIRSTLEKALEEFQTWRRSDTTKSDETPASRCVQDNNKVARQTAQAPGFGSLLSDEVYDSEDQDSKSDCSHAVTTCDRLANTLHHNKGDTTEEIKLLGERCFLPPNSSFLLSDMANVQILLTGSDKYNKIVLDPPWQNKSVKRKKTYFTLSNEDLLSLPMSELMDESAIVAVWVTNRQDQHRFVKEELFSHWNLEHQATWLWLKVTCDGKPVYDINSQHRKPYECIIFGSKGDLLHSIPCDYVVISVPCALHSNKPPLFDVLQLFSGNTASKCLELFARNLCPNVTSWGNEVIKFQHESYFVPMDSPSKLKVEQEEKPKTENDISNL